MSRMDGKKKEHFFYIKISACKSRYEGSKNCSNCSFLLLKNSLMSQIFTLAFLEMKSFGKDTTPLSLSKKTKISNLFQVNF